MTPTCTACGTEIVFYMHQTYSKVEGKMDYYHPWCCPDDRCREHADTVHNAVTAHLLEERRDVLPD